MIDLIAYIAQAQSELVRDQWQAVQESLNRLSYLLDIHTFTPEDMEQNQVTLTWPAKLDPIFEENERIIEDSKVRGKGFDGATYERDGEGEEIDISLCLYVYFTS